MPYLHTVRNWRKVRNSTTSGPWCAQTAIPFPTPEHELTLHGWSGDRSLESPVTRNWQTTSRQRYTGLLCSKSPSMEQNAGQRPRSTNRLCTPWRWRCSGGRSGGLTRLDHVMNEEGWESPQSQRKCEKHASGGIGIGHRGKLGRKNSPPIRPRRPSTARKTKEAVDGQRHRGHARQEPQPWGCPRPSQVETTEQSGRPRMNGRTPGKNNKNMANLANRTNWINQ